MKQIFLIRDFKIFEEQPITLNNLTVLAGSNSVGKSSIIQAILLSRATFELSKTSGKEKPISIPLNGPFLLELGNASEVIRRGKKVGESTLEFSLIQSDKIEMKIILRGDIASQNKYELLTESYEFPGVSNGIIGENIYYSSAERLGPRLKYDYDLLPFLHSGYRGERTFQILSGENMHIHIQKLFQKEEPALLLDQTRKWLNYIIPDANFDHAIPLGKSRTIEGTFDNSLPTNVGFGISYVLPIIVNGILAPPLSTMIVENPEAHLHPSGQSRIGKFLSQVAATGVQVIIETHSEHVINGIRIATVDGTLDNKLVTVNFISNDNKKIPSLKEIDINELGDLTNYPKGFFDQEQNDIATIIKHKLSLSK